MLIDGLPVVKKEKDASCVYDAEVKEVFAYAPGGPWSIGKSKALRERGTGHKCYFIGWPVKTMAKILKFEEVTK